MVETQRPGLELRFFSKQIFRAERVAIIALHENVTEHEPALSDRFAEALHH